MRWLRTAPQERFPSNGLGHINIINKNPQAYGREGMEELKLTLWDLNGNMVSYDELKAIFK